MFKSVFSRIMTTFSVIILVCILLLVFIVASGLFRESQAKELSELVVAAKEVAYFLRETQKSTREPTLQVLQSDAFLTGLTGVALNTDADISVLSMDGVILLTDSADWDPGERMMTHDTLSDLLEDPKAYALSDLAGALSSKRLNGFETVRNGDGDYLVVVTAHSAPTNELANSVTMLMVAVAIWIVFVAVICVFLISRRITDPIKQIGDAAKEYAQGRFNIRVNVDGQDEIAELGRAFNNMASSLATHEENRNTFIANVSHDLRTPMTTISGFVDGILDGTIPPEQQNHYLQTISGEVHRLSRLVNSLLQVSRLESGAKLRVSEFNLTEKARQVLLSLIGKIEAKKIDVDFEGGEEDLFVLADPDAIHQVLYNLLDNAAKFTEQGGKITVQIAAIRGRKAQVRVTNTGQSIPPEEIPHIFERFYKSDRSRGLDKTGTGLGLYIVKTVLDKHGESISVTSSPETGTTFCFSLSLAGGRQKSKPADGPDAEAD